MKQDTGSQAGDLYSAAVVIKEVFARNDPYTEYEDMDLAGMYNGPMKYIDVFLKGQACDMGLGYFYMVWNWRGLIVIRLLNRKIK